MLATSYTLSATTELGFAEAADRVREELKSEGFGVLCEIDVQATLKEKLGVEREPYLILGACNPPLAHQALADRARPRHAAALQRRRLPHATGRPTCPPIDAERMLSIVGNDAARTGRRRRPEQTRACRRARRQGLSRGPLHTNHYADAAAVSRRGSPIAASLVIDVRQPAEWRRGHIRGSVNLPLTQLASRLHQLPTGKTIVTVCASGHRSAVAARTLQSAGYPSENLKGGIRAWTRAGLPLQSAHN